MTPLNNCGCGRMPYFVSNRMSTTVDSRISICLPPSGIAETKFAACCDCGIQTRWFDSEFHAASIWNRAFPAQYGPLTNPSDIVDAVERAHKNTGDSKLRFKDNNGQ